MSRSTVPAPARSVTRGARWQRVATVAASLWAVVGLALTLQPPPESPAVMNRPLAERGDGFVSSASCRSCHPGEHGSWHASFHRTMTQVATPDTVAVELDGVKLELDGRHFSLRRDGNRYLAKEGDEVEREVVMLTGSHHQQNFWLETGEGRAVEPFPFGWLIKAQRWAPLTDTFVCPPEVHVGRAVASWNTSCINCHATAGRMRYEGEGLLFDSRVVEFGIACESCHGDAEAHVAKHHNPLTRYGARWDGEADDSIVNPARLDGPTSALACGQCHSVWAFDGREGMMASNERGLDFRSGDTSFDGRFLVQPGRPEHAEQLARLHAANPDFLPDTFWPDGMVRVTGREYNGLLTSPCFEGGEISCLSCHEMHPADTSTANLLTWRSDQLKAGTTGDQGCIQCHGDIAQDVSAHTFHAPESVGSRCYDCHMPHATYGLLGAVRNHRITSPTVRESLESGRPNACNLCHLDQPLSWTAAQLTRWYQQPAPLPGTMDVDERNVAAGALWMMRGDAAQRALVGWAMGQPEAHAAAGSAWMAPHLAISLDDPYAAVRSIAADALRALPGFGELDFDYTADGESTYTGAIAAFARARELVQRSAEPPPAPPTLVLPDGSFEPAAYDRLLNARDQRRVYLVE